MPTLDERGDHEGGLIALVRETASGFGQLVADHIRLARLEMTADAKSYVRDGSMLLIGGFVLAVGYGMACLAAGLALSRVIGGPMAFAGASCWPARATTVAVSHRPAAIKAAARRRWTVALLGCCRA